MLTRVNLNPDTFRRQCYQFVGGGWLAIATDAVEITRH